MLEIIAINTEDALAIEYYGANRIELVSGLTEAGGLKLNNLEKIKNHTNATDFHFGTAVRKNNSPFEKIDGNKIKEILNIINN